MPALFGDASTEEIGGWRPEPLQRGTFSILSSCIVTMTLCVWTSVHLNIPEHGEAHHVKWRKLWWLLIALFAPELVAWVAWCQYRAARDVYFEVKSRFGEDVPLTLAERLFQFIGWLCRPNAQRYIGRRRREQMDDEEGVAKPLTTVRKHPWTMTHSFYAIMGGFAFDTSNEDQNFLPGNRTRISLTKLGLDFLTYHEPDLLPDISETQIQDKSKANSLAKTIVCLQALWFCMQCVGRFISKTSISLLELNTFAHSLCTLLTYCLWWYKPLDVEEPSLITDRKMREICAEMCIRSRLAGDPVRKMTCMLRYINGERNQKMFPYRWMRNLGLAASMTRAVVNEEELLDGDSMRRLEMCEIYERAEANPYRAIDSHPNQIFLEPDGSLSMRLYMGQMLYNFLPTRETIKNRWFHRHFPFRELTGRQKPFPEQGVLSYSRSYITLTATDIQQMKLAAAWRHSRGYSGIRSTYVRDKAREWPGSLYTGSLWNLFAFCFAGFAYGGLHLAAWSAPFPSPREQILWRISSAFLAASGPVVICGIMISMDLDDWERYIPIPNFIKRWFEKKPMSDEDWYIDMLADIISDMIVQGMQTIVVGPIILGYPVTRIYLVVECFITMGHLPASVYEVQSWSQWLPHFG